ncbi:MAG: Sua5/YciO/YrdC/YwlC family protein [Pseudomonadota bacterium]
MSFTASSDQASIAYAIQSLHDGGVIAYPTESVWGLGCDPFNEAAVQRILTLKDRAESKGVILVASSVDQVSSMLYALTLDQRNDVIQSWQTPDSDGCSDTLVLPDPEHRLPQWIRGAHSSVAVRVSHHSVVKALCNGFSAPIVSTSANVSGQPAAMSIDEVRGYFPSNLDQVVEGALGHRSMPSRIRDAVSGQVLR